TNPSRSTKSAPRSTPSPRPAERPMPAFNLVWKSAYYDSVTLMRVTRDLESVPGVTRAAAMMATPQNRALRQDAGLLTIVGQPAEATDLVIAVVAADETIARRAESA